MTGQEIQDKLDKIQEDLETTFPNHAVQIPLRDSSNNITVYTLSSTAGVVDVTELAAIQSAINPMKTKADTYVTERAPVMTALDAFNVRRATHQTLIDAASTARAALTTATDADATYQSLKTALESARADAGYVAAVADYQDYQVSENFSNLGESRGNYFQS